MRSNRSSRTRYPGNSKSRRAPHAEALVPATRHTRPLYGAALLQQFEIYLQQHALSPATVRNYLADLRAFTRWQSARKNIGAGFPPADFGAYREHLCTETDHSPATVNRRLQSLRLLGRFLHETGQAAENPARDIELVHNGNGNVSAPRTLTPAEATRLLAALRAARPSLAARDLAVVQLMLQAGLRVHEVAALRQDDLALRGKRASVQVRGNRDSAPRVVPLNAEAARALREYLPARPAVPRVEQLFFSQRGLPLSLRSIQRLVDTYARAAGLKQVCAQSLRHTCARNLIAETGDAALVARWLGYRDSKVLERYAQ